MIELPLVFVYGRHLAINLGGIMRPKVIAIMQPVYLPWLGYFEQMAYADHFVFYDDVHYSKQNWRNRNKILSPTGPIWLTVPVKRAPLATAISKIEIDNRHFWAAKHIRSITFNYRRAPYFDQYFPMLRDILKQDWQKIADLDIALIQAICNDLGIAPAMSRSSDLPTDPSFTDQPKASTNDPVATRRNMRIIELCLHHKAKLFYVGASARDYIDIEMFARFGISVAFQDYVHPVYPQQTQGMHTHMAAIDLLMNTGPSAREVLLSARPPGFAGHTRLE